MLGGADKSNGDLGTYITGADNVLMTLPGNACIRACSASVCRGPARPPAPPACRATQAGWPYSSRMSAPHADSLSSNCKHPERNSTSTWSVAARTMPAFATGPNVPVLTPPVFVAAPLPSTMMQAAGYRWACKGNCPPSCGRLAANGKGNEPLRTPARAARSRNDGKRACQGPGDTASCLPGCSATRGYSFPGSLRRCTTGEWLAAWGEAGPVAMDPECRWSGPPLQQPCRGLRRPEPSVTRRFPNPYRRGIGSDQPGLP
ncbi:Uncharacterised protein [Serratia ficaria]|nr:Uncharacterised protein [Serratia ficaria]CAI2033436.1 Uncharacterised protein [Serratia ficaria]CAI2537557.1 Uncharacterised protein [Serratia ficaria]CAI2539399.1 Uncharacterised protein [Serratia ficaria]CAI2539999.1 Uncharacterised protein [Serratia ficaria]